MKTFTYHQCCAILRDLDGLIVWGSHPDYEANPSAVAARLVERRWAEPDEAADVAQQVFGWLALGGARRAADPAE
jgi:hypothetical protein